MFISSLHINKVNDDLHSKGPVTLRFHGLITAIARLKVVSREVDVVVRVDAVFKTRYRRVIDVVRRGNKSGRRWTR